MSWLTSFDPAAPRSSTASNLGDPYSTNGSQRRAQATTSNSYAGPSTVRSDNAASRQPASAPHQTGRTTRFYQPASAAGPSSSTYVPRPIRPPHRIKAAPPAAALRSEDAQPNENEARTKPWEIVAPPSIGKSKSSMPPPRPPRQTTHIRPYENRPAGSSKIFAAPKPSASRPLPQRRPPPPSQAPPQQKHKPLHPSPKTHPQPRNPYPTGFNPQAMSQLSKKQRKALRRKQEEERADQQRQQRYAQYTSKTQIQQPPMKKHKAEEPPAHSNRTWHAQAERPLSAASQHSQSSEGIGTPSPPPVRRTESNGGESSQAIPEPGAGVNIPTPSQLSGILDMVSKSPEKVQMQQQQQATEDARRVEEARRAAEVAQRAELARQAELARKEDEARQAESARKAEQARSAEQARKAEEARQAELAREAEEARRAEAARKAQEAERDRLADQARRAEEEDQIAEKARQAELARKQTRRSEEARQAEELARYLESLTDDESATSALEEPHTLKLAYQQASQSTRTSKAKVKDEEDEKDGLIDEDVKPSMSLSAKGKAAKHDESSDDDRPLAAALHDASRRDVLLPSCAQHLADDSDPDEDVPLQDLLQRRTSPNSTTCSGAKWPSTPFTPKLARVYSGAHGLSIRHFVPIASSLLDSSGRRGSTFDAAIAVSEHGKIATFCERSIDRVVGCESGLPVRMMEFRGDLEGKGKSWKSSIDRVEDVSRLTSKVCGIASSTKKPLGLGNHADYPCQVSLVTVNDGRHRTVHLDDKPHAWGVSSISHFPRTDPSNASAIDFATGGIDGIVNHWHWTSKSSSASTFRLHTLHDAKPVVALEHLSSRSNVLASASIGTVVGFDLAALTLGFSWNTSDRIVHLQRTTDPKLMLAVLARRDYDQFRMFDVTGRNGPVSRPVISFGWLNDSEGKLPVGRGSFHPSRRAIFAHAAEDGHVRIWDMRNPRDALVDVRLGDEPIVETVWGAAEAGDLLYVASPRGVRSVSLLTS